MGRDAVTTDELILRLEAERVRLGEHAVIATDCDGTLWSGDAGEAMFELALAERALRDEARSALATEARASGVPSDGDANAIAARLVDALRAGRYDEGRAFAMMAWAFAGFSGGELGRFAAGALEAFELVRRRRVEMEHVLCWAKERGVAVYLVSASPHAIIAEAADMLGLEVEGVLAMRPVEDRAGVIGATLASAPTYAEGKVARLAEVLEGRPVLAAFGDSGWDYAMLERAAVPVAVYPAPSLALRIEGLERVCILGGA